MSHLTELQFSMYLDQAVPNDELATLEQHLRDCSQCEHRANQLSLEAKLISAALAFNDETIPAPPAIKFARPIGLREFAIANVATGVVFWLAQFLWKTIFGEFIINGLTRISALYVPDVYGIFVNTTLYFSERGTAMIYSYFGYTLLVLVALFATLLIATYSKRRTVVGLFALFAISASLLNPSTAEALERRYSEETITISADEIIDDTLIVSADTVVIEGTVKGDLIAFGRKIIVSGPVAGNLMAFAESVNLSGDVKGLVLTAASTVIVDGSDIGGDFWSAAGNITVGKNTKIARNATLATETASIAGDIGSDAHLFGESFDIQGKVREDVVAYADRVNLLSGAHIFGNLSFHTDEEEKLQLAPTAIVDGDTNFHARSDRFQNQNKYLSAKFYLHQLFWIVSAFIFGFIILVLFPSLRELNLYGDMDGVKTAGVGLIAIVSMPILATLVAATLIGLPIAIVSFIGWALIIYASKIVLACVIGQMVFRNSAKEDSLVATLLVGLTIVLIASNIPVIGGVINFLLVIIGSGLIIQLLMEYISDVMASRTAA
jgi:cytoskeletal protein CcmA (bactofilin family)